ncbi:hypothetical protein JGU71_16800 [Antrihabitans sp. YC3-6]|uniref:Uncharacterized protein n=1 Tax=Antrihabitans stalagmiti TaxID=2799499 RepID=A0A934NSC7_9NOCA|nr:hypothetical protein [Antrihabitans stalagmiti]
MSENSDADRPEDATRPPVDRALLAKVFGDVLPDVTRDERNDGDEPRSGDGDDWLRSQIPPHHG